MKRTMVARDEFEVAAVGLDLFEQPFAVIEAVGSSSNDEFSKGASDGNFGSVRRPAARGHGLVARPAFLRGRRRGEPQIEVALLGREFAELANGHRVLNWRHGGP